VVHRNTCRLVKELKSRNLRTRKMLFKNRKEMMDNLPDRSVPLLECGSCKP
jgi:hypothetical protein